MITLFIPMLLSIVHETSPRADHPRSYLHLFYNTQQLDGKRIFKFKNIGTAPLVFTRISSSCGCTIPKKPEKPIEPGGEGEIEVEYDTKREGLFMKAISVVSNSKNPSTILRIIGEVLPEEEEEEEEEKGKD